MNKINIENNGQVDPCMYAMQFICQANIMIVQINCSVSLALAVRTSEQLVFLHQIVDSFARLLRI